MNIKRGRFDQIETVDSKPATNILDHFKPALPEQFVKFDMAGRGDALNHDLYGVDPEQDVAVVQVRHSFRRYRNGFLNQHKTYVLCGFNELTKQPFRHPVGAAAVRASIRRDPIDPAAPVRAAQRWMWEVTERQLAIGIRQGDVLLVPERGQPKVAKEIGTEHIVGQSHQIRAARVVVTIDGRVWAFSPSVWHAKNQHDPIFADHEGWHSVRVARQEMAWNFSVRLGD